MNGIENTKKEMPILKNDERLYVYLKGNHFQQNNVLTSSNDHVLNENVINIYIVYKLDPLASTRDKSFTIQNALFGAMQITKNATDYDKNNYKGYGICFDERSEFGHTITEGGHAHTTDARNVLIFGADMSFSVQATNRANHMYLMGSIIKGINDTTIYPEKNFYRNFADFGKKIVLSLHYNGDNSYLFVIGKDHITKINDTTIHAEKLFYRNFTESGKKFILSLHYNGDNSYLFVNGREELKFKTKTDQIINKNLCLGNLSRYWTKDQSTKTSLYGNIYDFVLDYKAIVGTTTIYHMHQYLMTKHIIES